MLNFQTDSDMSRPSTCSTQGQSRKLSAFTESYDGDTESLSRTGSEVENCSVLSSNCNELLSSRAFQMKTERKISSESSFTRESSSLVESDSETETLASNASTVNYTDSDFCRVQRPADEVGLVQSAEILAQCDERCKSEIECCESRRDTTAGLANLLYHAKQIPDETSNTCDVNIGGNSCPELFSLRRKSPINSTYDVHSEAKNSWTKMQLEKFDNRPETRNTVSFEARTADENKSTDPPRATENSFREVGLENSISSEKCEEKLGLTEQEIIKKQRALRNNFKEIVKEARKSVREARAKLSADKITPPSRSKAASKPQTQLSKAGSKPQNQHKRAINSKQSERFLNDPSKEKDAWVGKRAPVSPRSNQVLRERKKQDAIEFERRQVQILITELNFLDLHEQAANIKTALAIKENQEKEYDIHLEAERREIRRRKNIEISRQKQDAKWKRLEEIREIEAHRKEKEEVERKRRVEEAKKRREKNRLLWESYNDILLANSVTRSFTFSYFPRLQLQPVERPHTEPQVKTHSAKVREAREKHGEKCHQ